MFDSQLFWILVVAALSVYLCISSVRIHRLEKAICTHRSQRADDRCWEDDDRLYEALRDGIKCDRRVGNKTEMLRNCERFIDRRCQGGHWPTYQELEQEIVDLRVKLASLRVKLASLSEE